MRIKDLVASALFLAIAMYLPLLTGQIPQIGTMLSPMHIPVLLCGFVCGYKYAAIVGFIAPLLRYLVFGMPPIFPTGVSMAFELCAYGVVAGIMYQMLPKRKVNIYISLVTAMAVGRIVWGIVRFIIAGLQNTEFSFQMFLAGAFLNAVPGIILHIVLIPVIIIALESAGLIKDGKLA